HDIDGGDIVRVFVDQSGIPVVVTEIVADPVDDRGQPAVGHVRALVARTPGLREIDPRRLPNYPRNPRSAEGERWLVQNAPRAVLVAEFIAERRAPSGTTYGDDPRLFVQWSPAPIEAPDDQTADRLRQEPCDHVSPFAGAIVRFSQPIDPATVRALDTLFFATRDVLDGEGIREFVERRGIDPQAFNPDKYRTPHLIAATALPIDGSNTAFRLQTPFGFWLDEAMRRADEGQTFATKRHHYHLHVLGGANGIRDRAGNALDLQWTLTARDHVVIPFALDVRRDARGVPL